MATAPLRSETLEADGRTLKRLAKPLLLVGKGAAEVVSAMLARPADVEVARNGCSELVRLSFATEGKGPQP